MGYWSLRIGLSALLLAMGLTAYGFYEATSKPVARRAAISVDDWPKDTPPLRVLLLADTQMAGPDMWPERLTNIVNQVNQEQADIILLAGDFVSEKRLATRYYTADEAIAPLAKLAAPMGVYAVLGNHDYWSDEQGFVAALKRHDITLLRNEALAVGPFNLIGVDDEYTGRADLDKTAKSLAKLSQTAPNILFTHGPDIVPDLPFDTDIVMAGHTHCGQIALPIIGILSYVSRYGSRFNCGLIEDEGRKVIVTAGMGTSIMPIRIGAPPDYWVVTLGPDM
ncbi:metallophosphoesterase [Parasphingorhabdus sp. DH2-15]|uniref:metallophosphoesterase n=1 Tax=Parasphingorhabdus sp. DH2-15 TaxID=3444112 RepID=UPI003F684BA1